MPSARRLQRLNHFGWPAAILPESSRGEALAKAVRAPAGKRILLPRAQKAREELADILRRRGARVDVVEAYRTVADARSARRILKLAQAGAIDAVTFTSASTVEHFVSQLKLARCRKLFRRTAAASIGPVTSAALKARGIIPRVEASRASHESLLEALSSFFRRQERSEDRTLSQGA